MQDTQGIKWLQGRGAEAWCDPASAGLLKARFWFVFSLTHKPLVLKHQLPGARRGQLRLLHPGLLVLNYLVLQLLQGVDRSQV